MKKVAESTVVLDGFETVITLANDKKKGLDVITAQNEKLVWTLAKSNDGVNPLAILVINGEGFYNDNGENWKHKTSPQTVVNVNDQMNKDLNELWVSFGDMVISSILA